MQGARSTEARVNHSGFNQRTQTRRLYRSRTNVMVSGVAGGRADYFKVHPTVVRVLLFLLLLATTGPFGIVVDVILAAIIPEAPVTEQTPPLDA